jgi:hypothetical protein
MRRRLLRCESLHGLICKILVFLEQHDTNSACRHPNINRKTSLLRRALPISALWSFNDSRSFLHLSGTGITVRPTTLHLVPTPAPRKRRHPTKTTVNRILRNAELATGSVKKAENSGPQSRAEIAMIWRLGEGQYRRAFIVFFEDS